MGPWEYAGTKGGTVVRGCVFGLDILLSSVSSHRTQVCQLPRETVNFEGGFR